MALYEYVCRTCKSSFTKRMPMTDVVQELPCPTCGKPAGKAIGGWAFIGKADASLGDGPAPWDSDGDGDDGGDDFGGMGGDFGGHGHSHGPGGHSH